MRLILVEDHPVVRLGIRTVLNAQEDMEVVGEAGSAHEALSLAETLVPDLVILALRLEGQFQGIELCRELKALTEAPYILVYTSYNSPDDVYSCFLSGADSYVHKGEDSARLLDSTRQTYAGKRVWLLGVEVHDEALRLQGVIDDSTLTPREKEVLGFVLQGFTNPQIGNQLSIELPTVKTHVSSILRKLNLSSRRDLLH